MTLAITASVLSPGVSLNKSDLDHASSVAWPNGSLPRRSSHYALTTRISQSARDCAPRWRASSILPIPAVVRSSLVSSRPTYRKVVRSVALCLRRLEPFVSERSQTAFITSSPLLCLASLTHLAIYYLTNQPCPLSLETDRGSCERAERLVRRRSRYGPCSSLTRHSLCLCLSCSQIL